MTNKVGVLLTSYPFWNGNAPVQTYARRSLIYEWSYYTWRDFSRSLNIVLIQTLVKVGVEITPTRLRHKKFEDKPTRDVVHLKIFRNRTRYNFVYVLHVTKCNLIIIQIKGILNWSFTFCWIKKINNFIIY